MDYYAYVSACLVPLDTVLSWIVYQHQDYMLRLFPFLYPNL